jgi:hypothetical protein
MLSDSDVSISILGRVFVVGIYYLLNVVLFVCYFPWFD